jgi:phage tail-like protein
MRGTAPELDTPYPIATLMPAALQEDQLATRLTAGLDAVLSSVIATLDCLYTYIDPMLAPTDFLEWLAGWVGVALDENWSVERQRITVARAVQLYQSRGTVAGLAAHLEVITGGRVAVDDGGGVRWSTAPNTEPAHLRPPALRVRVHAPDPGAADPASLHAIIAWAKPAHVPHTVEVHG